MFFSPLFYFAPPLQHHQVLRDVTHTIKNKKSSNEQTATNESANNAGLRNVRKVLFKLAS